MQAKKLRTGPFMTQLYLAGEGEPVLFIHGSGPGASAYSNWHSTFLKLARGFLCLAPDLIGFGESDHPDPPPTGIRAWMREWMNQLLTLLDSLGVNKAYLVGNSLGGAIALHLLMEAQDRFKRAILMGPVGAPIRITPELERLWGFYEDPTSKNMENLIRWFVYDENLVIRRLEEIVSARLRVALRPEAKRSFEAMWPKPRQDHLDQLVLPPSALNRISIPILIVHGLYDKIVPIESSLYLVKHLPNASLYLMAKASHWVQIENETAFCNLLQMFFQGELT